MKVSKAIKILEFQKEKLETIESLNDRTWEIQTRSYLINFFSENSPEVNFLSKDKFFVSQYNNYGIKSASEIKRDTNDQIKIAKDFIDNCIKTLQDRNKLYKPPNFLTRLTDTAIWTTITIAVPGLLLVGSLFGKYLSDTQNFELKQQVKTLKDSLLILRSSTLPNTHPISDSNTNNTGKKISQ